MIKATGNKDGSFTVKMDVVDRVAIQRLADTYSIRVEDMLVGCINKGIEVIGKQVTENEPKGRPWCHG